ncbi:MAG: hypothetical protein R6W90_02900 [Ignavibacteriaceae bacterium]
MENKTVNGWSIEKGDYFKNEDDYTKSHKKAIKRIQMTNLTAVIIAFAAAFIFLLLVLSLISKV